MTLPRLPHVMINFAVLKIMGACLLFQCELTKILTLLILSLQLCSAHLNIVNMLIAHAILTVSLCIVVNKLMYSLVNPPCVLFKFVFTDMSIPASWKTANIMLIFKKALHLAQVIIGQ